VAKNKCTSVPGHFDGHASTLEQYIRHCLMRHVQGYLGSHWTPSLGNYLLCITPAAARATANGTTTEKWTNFAGHFDGGGGVPVSYRVHRPMKEIQGFDKINWTPPLGKYCS
jgi:hypothetical protein